MAEILRLYVGDVVELKKPHPCGANEWEILRLGVDVKLRCSGCGRIVAIPRVRLERRVRKFLRRGTTDTARAETDSGQRDR